jgi:hypothetical protein
MPYPRDTPTGEEIAEQVYFVNHFFAVKNLSWKKKGRKIVVLITRGQARDRRSIAKAQNRYRWHPETRHRPMGVNTI